MSIILIFIVAYCIAVPLLAVFIAFMVHTKRWETVTVKCGEIDCDLKCETCSLLPACFRKQAD